MNEPSWRYAEQRPTNLPSAHRERQERVADTFASLYREPTGSATSQGRAHRPAAHAGGSSGSGEADGWPVRRLSRGWGTLPARYGVLIVMAGAGVGAVATIVTASEPGTLLGVVLTAGALAGVLAVQPRAAYRLVPAPALAGFAAALLAGMVHDRAVDTSRTQVALNALGWMSGGFVAMAVATVVTLMVAVTRLVWHARRHQAGDDDDFAYVPWDDRPGR